MNSKEKKASVVMPLNSQMEMLLMQKDSGYLWCPNQWCFFGGQIENGENPEDALNRELSEELGGKKLLENVKFFGVYPFWDVHSVNGNKREGFIHVYSADFVGKISDINLKEGKGFTFLSRQEMDKYDLVWHNRKIIYDYYNSLLKKGN